jgi:hypothetical protein
VVYSAEGYAPHVVGLWKHAGTSVGNGVGRTPQRKECRTRLGAKDDIHGPARLLLPLVALSERFMGH